MSPPIYSNPLSERDSFEKAIEDTYGAVLMGVLVCAILFGVTNLQAFMYCQWYPKDTIWNKLSIGWLWLLDAVHLVFCADMLYEYFITDFGDILAIVQITWAFKAQIVTMALVWISVHVLYTIRIWRLAQKIDTAGPLVLRVLPMVATVTVFLLCGMIIVVSWEILRFDNWDGFFWDQGMWIFYTALGGAIGADTIVVGSLCYLLARCQTGFSSMDSKIKALIMYTVYTGMINLVCPIVGLAVAGKNYLVLTVLFITTKLYVNCYMAMFNARNSLHALDIPVFVPGHTPDTSRSCSGHGHTTSQEMFAPNRRRISVVAPRSAPISLAFLPSTLQAEGREQQINTDGETRVSSADTLSKEPRSFPDVINISALSLAELAVSDFPRANNDPGRNAISEEN